MHINVIVLDIENIFNLYESLPQIKVNIPYKSISNKSIKSIYNIEKKYLNSDEYKLYEIIWQRAVSSQMASAIIDQVSVDITNEQDIIVFRSNGSSIKFPGMLAVYQETKEEDKKVLEILRKL